MKPARVFICVGSFGAPVSFSSDELWILWEIMGRKKKMRRLLRKRPVFLQIYDDEGNGNPQVTQDGDVSLNFVTTYRRLRGVPKNSPKFPKKIQSAQALPDVLFMFLHAALSSDLNRTESKVNMDISGKRGQVPRGCSHVIPKNMGNPRKAIRNAGIPPYQPQKRTS